MATVVPVGGDLTLDASWAPTLVTAEPPPQRMDYSLAYDIVSQDCWRARKCCDDYVVQPILNCPSDLIKVSKCCAKVFCCCCGCCCCECDRDKFRNWWTWCKSAPNWC